MRMHDFSNTQQYNELQKSSTGSLRGKSKGPEDDAASLFSYGPRASPSKGGKSILYRMHNKPRKQLIIDGNSRYKASQDVQRFNEDIDAASLKSYGSLASRSKPPLNFKPK